MILGLVFAIGGNFATFLNMKEQLKDLNVVTTELNDKISNQKSEFNQQLIDIHKSTSKIEGQLELLINEK